MAAKYVRFVTLQKDDTTGRQTGFFSQAYELRRSSALAIEAHNELSSLLDWFDEYLDAPDKMVRSKSHSANPTALSWFKPAASDHIYRARQILEILQGAGILSEMKTTTRPGYVVYEDEFQIAATPFRDEP